MKTLLAALLLASVSAFAWDDDCKTGHTDGQCDDAKYFTCYVRDGYGKMFSRYSDGWADTSLTQYRAMKLCRNGSKRPSTCKPLGCQQTLP